MSKRPSVPAPSADPTYGHCCIDCGVVPEFLWFDGRCSRCGDEKWEREHPYFVATYEARREARDG